MKKKLSFLLAIFMAALLLVACGGQNQTSGGSTKNGQKLAQGITDKEIKVGLTGPQSGPVAEYDKVRKGLQAYFNYINDNGGVNGRNIKLIAYDDQYQPAKSLQSMQKLINQDKVFALLYPIGTANIGASLPLLEKSGIPVISLGTGAKKFVEPTIKNIFGGTFNYEIESTIFLDYAVNKLHAKKIAIAFQNDDFGKQGLEAAHKNIEKYKGVSIVKEVPFLATDKEFSSQAKQLKEAQPDVIIMNSTPAPAAGLRKELYKIGASKIPFIVSMTGGDDINQYNLAGKEAWTGVISSVDLLHYDKLSGPKVENYIKYVSKEYGKEALGPLTQKAWSAGQIFVEGLKRSGDDLTWDNYINKLNTFDNWTESFYTSINYSQNHHYGNTTLYITEAKDGKIEPISKKIYYDADKNEIIYEK
ncbi:ABC transporter substrate-binding protein [Rummeliibacillus sp. JY-2-4R]